ncbi:hypothetical protein PCANC_13634 [Puccinia coronata f. sp. avenae]|uniref:NADH dehydrogenase [ubiquinone] 1 alpha subcomplex assembly factor 3 n=1 Tax=Puccinia coronata f. sp. avenae TaxID=200324 RepID=A0A2N5S8V1_9BASI|nr:hypothetical protein PCANC_22234 [Puccinia coronata f. sp. avenae]PLW21437.1 hypothetical protein PCASD_17292 [Puccinia coronata f. sp. avenae]PLW38208.1 hypothetical protein PCANC_13634 [Puccinia coronata f. sp. avenae]PLW50886.1 hypothetical protein PCASD_01221 [Puccinia coronata f. sp. avenae]
MQTVRQLIRKSVLPQVRQSSSASKFTNIIQRGDGERGQASEDEVLSVRSVHERAFTLSNDTVVPANLFLYSARGMLWNPARDIYPDPRGPSTVPTQVAAQFRLLEILHPRPEMLILGAGKSILTIDPAKIATIKSYLNSLGIQLDVLDTRNGCSNYNLLVEEGRSVAGLFLTLEPVDSISSQLLSSSSSSAQ